MGQQALDPGGCWPGGETLPLGGGVLSVGSSPRKPGHRQGQACSADRSPASVIRGPVGGGVLFVMGAGGRLHSNPSPAYL